MFISENIYCVLTSKHKVTICLAAEANLTASGFLSWLMDPAVEGQLP